MKRAILAISVGLAMLSPATPAWAPPFDNAVALYDEGFYVRAAMLFRTLAMNGRPRAQARLAALHLDGTGVRQSDVQAYAWATIAAWQGGEAAVEIRNTAAARLTKELLARGERVAAEYWELYVVPYLE